jgi:predicted nicotinamide N-methyase
MPAADAPVVEALRARLEPRLRALRGGRAPSEAILDLAVRRFEMPGGDVVLVRPRDWPALLEAERGLDRDAPFWAVSWTSGEALARRIAEERPRGQRLLDLGCGLGLVSIVAARAGADVLAVDAHPDAVAFAAENLALNGVDADAAVASWEDPALANAGPFDLISGGDVLYSRRGAESLLSALDPLLSEGGEVWLTDPGRAAAEAFVTAAGAAWDVVDEPLGGDVVLHRLRRS